MEEVYKKIDELIKLVIDSNEYKMCIDIKDKLDSNEDIKLLINKTKEYQKKYINSGYSEDIKNELDKYYLELSEIPIYSIYLDNLRIVNQKIEYIKEELNEYFDDLLK